MATSNKSDISDYSLREILNNAKGNRCGGLKQKAARSKLDFAPVFLHRTYIKYFIMKYRFVIVLTTLRKNSAELTLTEIYIF
ncbi:hypothetical protein B1J94_15225 [Leptospira kirschneri serovar Grippotyphosa]|nr:hypothetical protein B1J94_15225 [Leptospira kirschneri serovar Grippotyphosa]